jgi:hypothetical protein
MDAVARSVAVGEAVLQLSGKAKRAAKRPLMWGGGALEGSVPRRPGNGPPMKNRIHKACERAPTSCLTSAGERAP